MPHVEDPAIVHRGRTSSQPQRATDVYDQRSFFCRTCGREEIAARIPNGWYTLERRDDSMNNRGRTIRLGIYCSIGCIDDQIPRLGGIEEAGLRRPVRQRRDA